jgi:hypothetical protein
MHARGTRAQNIKTCTCSCGLTTESEASVPILQVPTMALPLCSVFRMYLSTSSSDCAVPTSVVLGSFHLAHCRSIMTKHIRYVSNLAAISEWRQQASSFTKQPGKQLMGQVCENRWHAR